ncbi:30S ribosomal protein S15 [Neolewinella antarctica]|uniref:Small ribosomal subunit protein uS15 n=1 Tax=Neolewinella antarctica TaxID=442734 RepID=A0ABX0X9N7_9BACT|nr:30S ribosomal protein S15 [Neolewinella antarctica]NJC25947.1 small subunit ribosomal protein S15 [Neolewinella antarctica]
MAVYLAKEKIEEIFAEYAGDAKNTGNTEGQIALFTYRIQELSEHLQRHRKDHSSRKALLSLVGQRRRHLAYLQKKNLTGYRELIAKLGIRK